MSSPNPGKRRMDTDVIKLIESQHEVTILGGLNEFMVKFVGPKTTPYDGGVWKVRVDLPDKYPFKSPSIGFMNRVFHPNIDEASGTVCLDVINQTWTPMYDLVNVFESFLPQLLTYPNPVDPLNGDAAALFLHKPEEYKAKVREYVKKYATDEVLKAQEAHRSGHSSNNNNNNNNNNHHNNNHHGGSGASSSSSSSTSSSSSSNNNSTIQQQNGAAPTTSSSSSNLSYSSSSNQNTPTNSNSRSQASSALAAAASTTTGTCTATSATSSNKNISNSSSTTATGARGGGGGGDGGSDSESSMSDFEEDEVPGMEL